MRLFTHHTQSFIKNSLSEFSNVEVDFFEGLTVDYCFEKKAQFILRGLRNPADFEFEKAGICIGC